jgi:hypothetical protein
MDTIRIGVKGWDEASYAKRRVDVRAGLDVEWVEVEGVRIHRVTGARIHLFKGFHTVTLELGPGPHDKSVAMELDVLGAVELVYLGADGEPLT